MRWDYDPKEHITAQAIRRMGIPLPENLEDEAYVARDAVGLAGDEMLGDGSPTPRLRLLEYFREPIPA